MNNIHKKVAIQSIHIRFVIIARIVVRLGPTDNVSLVCNNLTKQSD